MWGEALTGLPFSFASFSFGQAKENEGDS